MTRNLKDRTQPLFAVVSIEMFADRLHGKYLVQRTPRTAFIEASHSCDNLGNNWSRQKLIFETH